MRISPIPLFTVLLIFSILTKQANARFNTTVVHDTSSRVVTDLSGMKWRMKMMLPGEGVKEGLPDLPSEDIETLVWNNAEVPGDVYTDLMKANAIDDPYFGRNSIRAQWVQHYEWWYSLQFYYYNVIKDDEYIELVFEGVDYSCEVWLNGNYLGKHEGAFTKFSFKVNEHLRSNQYDWRKASNLLMIKLDPPPKVNARVAGRKTPWFGDYWRDLIPFGIVRPVKLVNTGKVRFDDVYVNNSINLDGSADVKLELTIDNTGNTTREITFLASLEGSNFSMEKIYTEFNTSIPPGKHTVEKTIHLTEPQLWWPWDLGKPNLYKAKITVKEDTVGHDFNETIFGIREVTSKWNPGFEKGVDISFPRSTYINGKFHFIRSACWGGPPDIFVGRTNIDEYKELIRLAKAANMNNIRIFGWHPPEIPEFYQYCNEMGITVWQDMIPLGTGNFPTDRETVEQILNTAVHVTKERRNHPSFIMTEGGEEMFLRAEDPHFARAFAEELGDSITKHFKIPYVPDSPLTCDIALEAGYKPKEAKHALRYFYELGTWLHEDWIRTIASGYPIIPEFAITSVPSVKSLKKFIPEDELWPPGLSWGHHWADLNRLRMQNWDVFGDEMTGSLEEFVKATQESQGVIFQTGVEHFRREKPGLSGIAICHLITYWPDMKWGIIDNYQQPKRSYHILAKAYQPLLVNFEFTKRRWHNDEPFIGNIWIVNDYYTSYENCEIKFIMTDDGGKNIASRKFEVSNIDENSAQLFFPISEAVLKSVKKKFFVELELTDNDGTIISSNNYFFLIGNQEEATKAFVDWRDRRLEMENGNGHGGYGTYYHFFEEFTRENGKDYDGASQSPKARGFDDQ